MCVCVCVCVCVCQELEGVNEANRQALATLDSAMFVLCLDDAEVTNEIEATHTLLHNYGANRYALLQRGSEVACILCPQMV